jgi:hypothetical protein
LLTKKDIQRLENIIKQEKKLKKAKTKESKCKIYNEIIKKNKKYINDINNTREMKPLTIELSKAEKHFTDENFSLALTNYENWFKNIKSILDKEKKKR